MLSRCLNPSCGAPFRYLHEGRIFNVERVCAMPGDPEPQHLVEHYWLCGACSLLFKVVVENGCVTTRPIDSQTAVENVTAADLDASLSKHRVS